MRVGVALGSGSARGWAHFGVLAELETMGVRPAVVAGTSIGALVGAAVASGKGAEMRAWVESLGVTEVLTLLDFSLKGGALAGERVIEYCASHFFAERFEKLQLPFGCVATDLASGREVWLRSGSVAEAVRASIAMPGVFAPQRFDGRWLVDGGLVNPVPVSLCRALGADVVIAVDLMAGRASRHLRGGRNGGRWGEDLWGRLRQWIGPRGRLEREEGEKGEEGEAEEPSLPSVVAAAINVMQTRIARARLAGDPPEVLIQPRLADFSLFDFHRGREAIAEGAGATRRLRPLIEAVLQE
ncbi:MAG: patatin-like phospholipase family protein [Hydrogenophilus sp.]|nr:patatin-like phospholipase family protein [Hydrogenophilus sp.]